MSIDIKQFHGVFFDESDEHIQEMERQLMALDPASPDAEALHSVFRSAHSIKGGSGIFGFDALTNLTHVMENLLDRARNGQQQVTTDIVDLLLSTLDVLIDTLQAYRNDSDVPQEAIEAAIGALEACLCADTVQVAVEDNQSANTEDDGFGFFDDDNALCGQTENVGDDIEGFGLFAPLSEGESPEDTAHCASSKQNDDDGFGFFETPAISKEPEPVSASTPKQTIRKPVKTSSSGKEAASIRVDTTKVDAMVNLVGELVITQSMLSMIGQEVDGQVGERLQLAIDELQRNTREIQESVMSMRMLPLNMTFNRFPRVVRDLSAKLGKKVTLHIEGGATEIDKSLIEKLVDPLTHLVRNSIDHGIETVEKRVAAGKTESGNVILKASQRGSSIIISITDDGAGLNRERILEKASQNHLPVSDDMADADVWQLIFQPGFSTASEVTDVSGRGVGMDVVRRNIESIGGRIEIESTAGEGSAFFIHLPLTLAIVDGMCVSVGEQIFVIPLLNVIESFQPLPEQLKTLGNEQLLWIRDQYWPLVHLHNHMQVDGAIQTPTEGIVVLLESSKKRYGVLIDSLMGQQQVVIKSLEQHYKKVDGVAGATIMGDGKVAMILDADSLADACTTGISEELTA